jgi:hypothetical protein
MMNISIRVCTGMPLSGGVAEVGRVYLCLEHQSLAVQMLHQGLDVPLLLDVAQLPDDGDDGAMESDDS